MNTQAKILLLILWGIFGSGLARAQDDADQNAAPSHPYLRTLPANFSMAKQFTYIAPETPLPPQQSAAANVLNPASAKLKDFKAVARGGIRKDTETYLDGSSRDTWRIKSCRLTVNSAHPDFVMYNIATTAPYNPAAQNQYRDNTDFDELSWIEQASFQGIQMQQGKKCFLFKSGDLTAWIDVATHLPIYFTSKDVQVSYTYSDPPDGPLQIPAPVADKFDKVNRLMHGQL